MKTLSFDTLVTATPPIDTPDAPQSVVATLSGEIQLCHIHAKATRTATYDVEVVRYECDPWDDVPTVVDTATVKLEASIDLLSSESAIAAWVELSLPGWSYLSSYNACSLKAAKPSPEWF